MEIILYRERERGRERSSMHCQGSACNRSFDMGLASAEGLKLGCLNVQIEIFS